MGPLARSHRLVVESLCGLVVGWAVGSLSLTALAGPRAVAVVAVAGVLTVATGRPAAALGYLAAVLGYAVALYVTLLLQLGGLAAGT